MEKELLENEVDKLQLDYERICILYGNARLGYFGLFLSLFFLGFIVSRLSSPVLAVIWMTTVVVAYIPRIILTARFKTKLDRKEITPTNIKPWENYFFVNTIIPHISFTAVVFFPYKEHTFTAVLFCAVVFMSMIAGGSMAYNTSKKFVFLFMSIALFFLVIKCFWMREFIFTALAFYLIVGYGILTKLILRQNEILLENISLKIESRHQSFIDPLTKLWNRRRLYLLIDKMIELSKRSGDPFSLILLDIDHFKKFNDTHGHNAGDTLLVRLAELLLDCCREQDLVVRYGGEEFMVVLPNTTINQAKIIAERIHTTVRKNTDVTVSAGLAQYTGQLNFAHMVQQADEALYAAKNKGRDRFTVVVSN